MKKVWFARLWVGVMVPLMACLHVQAASYWFDNNGTTDGFGVVDGGSYDWWAGTCWTTNAAGGSAVLVSWPGSGNQAFLTGAGANTTYKIRMGSDGKTNATLQNFAINVNADASGASGAGNVTIGDPGDTGTLILSANNSVGAQAGGTLVVNNPINLNGKTLNFRGGNVILNGVVSGTGSSKFAFGSGAFGLSSGTLTLANTANTYAGRTTDDWIGSGYTLVVTKLADGGANSSIGSSSANIGLNGGTLKFVGTGAQSSNLGFKIASGNATIEAAGPSSSDTITFSGAPTYSAVNVPRTNNVTGENTGPNTLAFDYGNNGTAANAFFKKGNGTWVLTGSNSFTGALVVEAGMLIAGRTNALGLATRIVNLGTSSTTGTVVFATDDVAVPYVLNVGSGNRGAVQVGRATSGAALTYKTATCTLGNSTLYVQAGPNVASGTPVLEFGGITLSAGATGLSTGTMLEPTTANVLVSGNITQSGAQANRLTLAGTSTGNLISGIISGTQAFYKTGSGKWTLSGANTLSGTTSVEGGTLVIANNLALQSSPLNTVFTGGGLLDLTGVNTPTIGGLTGNAAFALPGNVTALTLNPSATVTQSGSISGGASGLTLTKSGAGTQVLSASNGYSGLTTVSGGALRISHAGALGSTASGVTVSSGARLELAGDIVVSGETVRTSGNGGNFCGGLQSASGSNTWNGPVILAAQDSRLGAFVGTLVVGGAIDDEDATFNLILRSGDDSGTVVLAATNTYGGATQFAIGKVVLGVPNAIPSGSALLFGLSNRSGLLDLAGNDQTVSGMTVAQTTEANVNLLTNSAATVAMLTVNVSGSSTYNGKIGGLLAIQKAGIGTLTFSGTNTYSGGTIVSNGTLRISSPSALPAVGAVTLAAGATLDIVGTSPIASPVTVASMASSGGIVKLSLTDRLLVSDNMSGTFRFSLSNPEQLSEDTAYVLAHFGGTPPASVVLEGVGAPWVIKVSNGDVRLFRTTGTRVSFF